MDDGGVYEVAFGLAGVMHDAWGQDSLNETLLAIAYHLRISEESKLLAKKETDLRFLNRLRFHTLALAGTRNQTLTPNDIASQLASQSQFDLSFDEIWPIARSVIINVVVQAESEGSTMFALVRSAERWKQMQRTFKLQIAAR
jgi:hypothetical protein